MFGKCQISKEYVGLLFHKKKKIRYMLSKNFVTSVHCVVGFFYMFVKNFLFNDIVIFLQFDHFCQPFFQL